MEKVKFLLPYLHSGTTVSLCDSLYPIGYVCSLFSSVQFAVCSLVGA